MKTLVIYDSYFSNTEQIAQAIASELDAQGEVVVKKISDAVLDDLQGVELLLVGSPTRGFRPTPTILDFIKGLPDGGLKDVKTAGFDTRIGGEDIDSKFLRGLVKMGGYAAKPIDKALIKKGGTQALPPEGFFVGDTEGPLKEGELERAAEWVKGL